MNFVKVDGTFEKEIGYFHPDLDPSLNGVKPQE